MSRFPVLCAPCSRRSTCVRGFSLLELTLATALGVMVVTSAVGIFISNRHTHDATASLSRIQENARMAFDVLVGDIRAAGGNPCGRNLVLTSVVNGAGDRWWASLGQPVRGFDDDEPFPDAGFGSVPGQRIAGTDGIQITSATAVAMRVIEHNTSAATFMLSGNRDIEQGDIAMVCDVSQATVFQVTAAAPGSGALIGYDAVTGNPGNCSQGLGFPTRCTATGTVYRYRDNAALSRLDARRWFIGYNARSGRSLFQTVLRSNGGAAALVDEEIIEGVTDMQIRYLFADGNDYVAASEVPASRWHQVRALRIDLTIADVQATPATQASTRSRSLAQTIALRNAMP